MTDPVGYEPEASSPVLLDPLPTTALAPLAFDDVGTGQPVVLIHAFPLDRTMWQPLMFLAGQELRLIAPDLRGFGDSPSTTGEAIAMRNYGADVVALLDRLGLRSAAICGLSLGGYVALAIAEQAPERVDALILANTRATADDDASRAKRQAQAARVAEEGMVVLTEEVVPKLLGPGADPEARSLVDSVVSRQEPRGAVSAILGMADRVDRSDLLGKLTMPVLVITSEQDVLVPPAASKAMAAAIPGSAVVEIPGAGHLSAVEQPAAFALAIETFLRERRPA
jgi:pimeloyl-ACP methyl ester carboxylesterase